MKKLQNYVEDITFVGVIKDEISLHLDKSSIMTKSIVGNRFLSSIYSVEHYSNKLQQYENTIALMLKFIANFEFCTDVKRNFTPKQVE